MKREFKELARFKQVNKWLKEIKSALGEHFQRTAPELPSEELERQEEKETPIK